MAASTATALLGSAAGPAAAGEGSSPAHDTVEAIHFPTSFLYCVPLDSGIWVRVQMECRGCLVDVATGESDEYVMGVVAKTGLTTNPMKSTTAPGYDYWIIFSRRHVFTKRTFSSTYLNNPTVLTHQEFGEAKWRLRRLTAERVRTAADVRASLATWRELTATTTFTSQDGQRQFRVDYPVKWADYQLQRDGFRIETGPIFFLNPNEVRVGKVPAFADFQWAHVDYHSFEKVRCLFEQPTSILADLTFVPPVEHGRQFREHPAVTSSQFAALRRVLFSVEETGLSKEALNSLLSINHYSHARDLAAKTELYAFVN